MCSGNIMKPIGKVLDPIGITQKTHAAIAPYREKMYRSLGIQQYMMRDGIAEAGGASKYYTTKDDIAAAKAEKNAQRVAALRIGTTDKTGLQIGKKYS